MGTLKIINAEYIKEYVLLLTFNNGEKRYCDFWPLSQKGDCKKLRDIDYFKKFSLDPFTVDWNNEIGFAPEFLYDNSTIEPYFNNENVNTNMVANDTELEYLPSKNS